LTVRLLALSLFLGIVLITGNVRGQNAAPVPDYFVEASVNNPTPYVGQQITYRARFYDAVDVANPLYEAPDFEGFWRIDRQNVARSVQQLNNRQYTVTEVDTALYPTRPGAITIFPAKVLLPETVFRAKEEISALPVTVEVKPLPEDAPDGFTGAVGQFDLSAILDRQSANFGEPFILQLTVTGTGNVEQLTPPDLPVPGDWRVYDNPSTFTTGEVNDSVVGKKTYEYLLIPGQPGSQPLPAITLAFFDPESATYRAVSTTPVTLEVLTTGETTIQPTEVALIAPSLATLLPLSQLSTIAPNDGIFSGLLIVVLWLFPPLIAGGCWWWVRWRERQSRRQALMRKSMALVRAQTRLGRLLTTVDRQAYLLVQEAILDYFGDKLGHQSKNWMDSDLQSRLDKMSLPANLSARVMLCLEWAGEGQYAPTGAVDVPTLVNRTSETLAVVDEMLNVK
jgi:hypothetical protein